jgi:hypothetical protein
MTLFHISEHWTDTYVTGGFSQHIRFGRFFTNNSPRLNTTILRGLFTIMNYNNAALHKTNTNIFGFLVFLLLVSVVPLRFQSIHSNRGLSSSPYPPVPSAQDKNFRGISVKYIEK